MFLVGEGWVEVGMNTNFCPTCLAEVGQYFDKSHRISSLSLWERVGVRGKFKELKQHAII
ncbi:hypothetical protein BSQ40_11245 [Serratia fonticola]|nr:hypothetical protein BSQ40_11245 [Serratia fonticola]